MKILITGNMGYIGPVVCRHLREIFPDSYLIGYDAGYFAHCITGAKLLPETMLNEQHFGDVRDFPSHLLNGVDAVVELAAISNDPMGVRFESVTREINSISAVSIAEMALDYGVKSVVFASSCSIYGASDGASKKESDSLNPLTAYAISKVDAELKLLSLADTTNTITCLRFATACGMSPRLRLDLVLNDFVACAVTRNEITVLSDGTPWRPLIEVKDMARAIEWALVRDPFDAGHFVSVNVGSASWNYQVSELAYAVSRLVPGTKVSINANAPIDKRSYQVDFSLFQKIAPHHQPKFTLDEAIMELKSGLEEFKFINDDFRNSELMRLKVLERHINGKRLDENLRWA